MQVAGGSLWSNQNSVNEVSKNDRLWVLYFCVIDDRQNNYRHLPICIYYSSKVHIFRLCILCMFKHGKLECFGTALG